MRKHNKYKLPLIIIGACILMITLMSVANNQQPVTIDTSNYKLVFSDEFNMPNGSQPDSTKWRKCVRFNSLWSRWLSNSKDVVYIKNGKLICRAIPNKKEKNDTAQMLTGGIETYGNFSLLYGKIEAKMRTNSKKGNFPAIWTRNVTQASNAPYSEIDIVEMFGSQKKSFHTAHTQYTVSTSNHREQNTYNIKLDPTKWHVYGLIWTPTMLVWTVDGKEVGRYIKSDDTTLAQKGQWTFNTPHFLRINQSVGHGVHGMVQDVNTSYTTEVDWIRVYQP